MSIANRMRKKLGKQSDSKKPQKDYIAWHKPN
jgi:hypothetical protein